MHRWQFQRLFRWLIPTLVFLLLLCVVVLLEKHSVGRLTFVDDASFVNVAVARTVVDSHLYGLQPGAPMPAVQDGLWRMLLAFCGWITGDFSGMAIVLGAAFALLTVLLCLRFARLLFPFPPFILYASVLLIVAPRLLMDAVSGTSLPLATALVTAACLLHIEGLANRMTPLSVRSAILVGLLLMIRLEFALLWVVFFLHAFVLSLFRSRGPTAAIYVITRGITGLMVLALCFFPLLAWNLNVARVPWPQAVGAPFTMDAWLSSSPTAILHDYLAWAWHAIPAAYAQLYQTPFLGGILERLLTWFGVLSIAGLSIWRHEERPYTLLLFVLLLLPPCYALAYPYLGWHAASMVFSTLSPLWIMAAAFGIFRIPFLIENLYRKWKQGLPEAQGFSIWWAVMCSVLLILCVTKTGIQLHRHLGAAVERQTIRQALSEAIDAGQFGALCASDEPGWLAFVAGEHVIDLNGECTLEVLTCLDGRGNLDIAKLAGYLAERKPDSLLLWKQDRDAIVAAVPCQRVPLARKPDAESWPTLCALNWYGVF